MAMKHAALTALFALVLGVAALPVVFTGGETTSSAVAVGCASGDGSIEQILATIRQVESGGNYTARARGSTASGAYQFLDSTWHGYGGYTSAWQAPPVVQDAKAAEHVQGILDAHHGDVTAVPLVWYIGYVPAPGSPDWDTVPYPSAGNVLTPRQYRGRWLQAFGRTGSVPSCAAQH